MQWAYIRAQPPPLLSSFPPMQRWHRHHSHHSHLHRRHSHPHLRIRLHHRRHHHLSQDQRHHLNLGPLHKALWTAWRAPYPKLICRSRNPCTLLSAQLHIEAAGKRAHDQLVHRAVSYRSGTMTFESSVSNPLENTEYQCNCRHLPHTNRSAGCIQRNWYLHVYIVARHKLQYGTSITLLYKLVPKRN